MCRVCGSAYGFGPPARVPRNRIRQDRHRIACEHSSLPSQVEAMTSRPWGSGTAAPQFFPLCDSTSAHAAGRRPWRRRHRAGGSVRTRPGVQPFCHYVEKPFALEPGFGWECLSVHYSADSARALSPPSSSTGLRLPSESFSRPTRSRSIPGKVASGRSFKVMNEYRRPPIRMYVSSSCSMFQ